MTTHQCQECGDTVEGGPEESEWNCVMCGGRVVPMNESKVVHKDELRGLVENMRETEERGMMPAQRETAGRYADELEELLDDKPDFEKEKTDFIEYEADESTYLIDCMPSVQNAARENPDFQVLESGDVTLADGVQEGTLRVEGDENE